MALSRFATSSRPIRRENRRRFRDCEQTIDIIYACWKALAQAWPERACAGWGKACYGLSSGRGAQGRVFVMYHWHGSSGGGAVMGRDGFQSVGHMISLGGLTLPNVEGYELA